MRRILPALLSLAFASSAAAQEKSLLILEFKHEKGDEQTARLLNDLAAAAAERVPGLKVITGADIANVIDLEADRAELGCDTGAASCMAEVANAMGADLVLFGNVGRLGEIFVVTMNLFYSDQARSAGRETIRARDLAELPDAVDAAVARLLGSKSDVQQGPGPLFVTGAVLAGAGAALGVAGLTLAALQNDVLASTESSGPEKDSAFVLGHAFFWPGVVGFAASAAGLGLMFIPEE